MDTFTKKPDLGEGLKESNGVKVDLVYLALLASYLAKGNFLTVENKLESLAQSTQGCIHLVIFDVPIRYVCDLAGMCNKRYSQIPWEFDHHFTQIHRILRWLPPTAQTLLVRLAREYDRYHTTYAHVNEADKNNRLYQLLNNWRF